MCEPERLCCPLCGGEKLAPILYGMPLLDEATAQKLARQELWLGGCCIVENAPKYHCFDCGEDVDPTPAEEL